MASEGMLKSLSQKWGTIEAENAKMFETAIAVGCLAYLAAVLIGGFWNRRISLKVKKIFNSTMAEQFSQVGMRDEGGEMLVDGLGMSYLYATGRKNVKYMKVCLETRRRQDLFSVARELVFGFTGDRAKVIIPFSVTVEPIILVICKRKHVRTLLEENESVNTYAKTIAWPPGAAAPESLDILGESSDVAQTLLSASVIKQIAQLEELIVSLHISDHGLSEQQAGEEKSVMVCDFVLPKAEDDIRQLLFQVSELGTKGWNFGVTQNPCADGMWSLRALH